MRCFIAAGHGPYGRKIEPPAGWRYDPGFVTPEVDEHKVADEIARSLARGLERVEPHMVPRASLRDRIAYVNRWSRPGDVAVEIHLNSGLPAASGAETYYASGSATGKELASALHASLVRIGRPPRGPKPDTQSAHGSLGWCRRTRPWAALVEVAFLSNHDERRWLLAGGIEEAAKALASAIDGWA